jgi:hypothetical protein
VRVALFSQLDCTDARSREAAWKVLAAEPEFRVDRVTTASLMAPGFPGKYDVFILPGGTANGEARALGVEGCRRIEEFVASGNGVIGICAGGYLVVEGWNPATRALQLLRAVSWDDDHWARGEQFIAVQLAGRNDSESSRTMWFQNGPIFVPGTLPGIPAYSPLVRYVTDLAAKDAPTGMMTGRDAVIAGTLGKGRVVAFGPHPELSPGLNHWLVNAAKWAAAGDNGTSPTVEAVLEGESR